MADRKNCKYYAVCDYRNDVGKCPDRCVQYKHKDDVRVVRCEKCVYGKLDKAAFYHDVYGNENDTTLYHCLYGFGHNKGEHFCSYGERRIDG